MVARVGATWFGRNRRAGRVILYHRHLGPVLIRAWSTPIDLFTGTVAASADTSTFHDTSTQHTTSDDEHELITAEHLRPIPAPSGHLANAVNPVPWPT